MKSSRVCSPSEIDVQPGRDLVVHRGDDGVLLQLGDVVGPELVEVRGRVFEPAGKGIAPDHGRSQRGSLAYPRTMVGIETLEYCDVAKTIDHSLLRPELDLDTVREGVELALRYDVASATVRPADVALAAELVAGSDVMISTVVGFPHGSHTTATKAVETEELIAAGADEIDMVLNIGRLISGEDEYVERDIRAVVEAAAGADREGDLRERVPRTTRRRSARAS